MIQWFCWEFGICAERKVIAKWSDIPGITWASKMKLKIISQSIYLALELVHL